MRTRLALLRPRRVALIASLFALPIALAVAVTRPDERAADRIAPLPLSIDQAFEPQLERLQELLSGDAAPDDGVYSWSTGYEGATLHYGQSVGYAYQHNTCISHYRSVGEVRLGDALLQLRRRSASEPVWGAEPPRLIPVRWGERRYLVPEDELGDFAYSIFDEEEPRCGEHGRFLMREGGERLVVSGPPELPPAWRGLLRREAAEVRVTRVEVKSSPARGFVHTLTLDGGADRGLVAGMLLSPRRGEPFHTRVKVVRVNAQDAVAVTDVSPGLPPPPPPPAPPDAGADRSLPRAYSPREQVIGPSPGAVYASGVLPASIDAAHCTSVVRR